MRLKRQHRLGEPPKTAAPSVAASNGLGSVEDELAQIAAAAMAAIFRRDVQAVEDLEGRFSCDSVAALAWKLLALDLLLAQSVREHRPPEHVAQEYACLLASKQA